MRTKLLLTSAFVAFFALTAFGQNPPAVRVMGTVQSLHGRTLMVKSQDGKEVSVMLPADVKIVADAKSSLAEIKQGDFIGSAAVATKSGVLRAQEVHIFPAEMRGTGEGHRPMGPNPDRTMTNGNITAVHSAVHSMTNGTVSGVSGSRDRVLTVAYKGGEQRIEVDPSTPVIMIVPGSEALLKPGAAVSIFATKTAHGLSARFITAEKNGVKPLE